MKPASKLPRAVAIAAFLIAAITLLSAFQHVVLALFSLIPLFAGIGILRKRVWSAYGFALFALAQLAVTPLLLRTGSIPPRQIVFAAALNLILFLFSSSPANRSPPAAHRAAHPSRGLPLPASSLSPSIFVQAFVIPSGAMEDTLLIGDHILARVFPRVTPVEGDIVVFHYPIDRSQIFVKRVIGVPGDRIRIASKIVYRNGAALNEPYAVHKFNSVDNYRDNFPGDPADIPIPPRPREMLAARAMLQNHVTRGEAVVPPGNYFVLGDNRDNSLDSRYWGFLDASDIIGKPILIYDSEEQPAEEPGLAKPLSRPRIRWNRLFKPL